MELQGGATGQPLTYMIEGPQYIAVAVGRKGAQPKLVALPLQPH